METDVQQCACPHAFDSKSKSRHRCRFYFSRSIPPASVEDISGGYFKFFLLI